MIAPAPGEELFTKRVALLEREREVVAYEPPPSLPPREVERPAIVEKPALERQETDMTNAAPPPIEPTFARVQGARRVKTPRTPRQAREKKSDRVRAAVMPRGRRTDDARAVREVRAVEERSRERNRPGPDTGAPTPQGVDASLSFGFGDIIAFGIVAALLVGLLFGAKKLGLA